MVKSRVRADIDDAWMWLIPIGRCLLGGLTRKSGVMPRGQRKGLGKGWPMDWVHRGEGSRPAWKGVERKTEGGICSGYSKTRICL